MPDLSIAMRKALLARGASEDVILLAIITHPDWEGSLRFCNLAIETMTEADDTVRRITRSGGYEYEHRIVSGIGPDDEEGSLPSMPLVLDNAGYFAAALLDEDLTQATVDLILVVKSDPEEIVEEVLGFEITDADAVNETVTLTLALDPDDPSEPACARRMTRDELPVLFYS